MRRDIINAQVLHDKIDELLATTPGILHAWRPQIGGWLRNVAELDDSVMPARRRQCDPDWAKSKFDAGRQLYRFWPDKLDDADYGEVFEGLARLAGIAKAPGSVARAAGNVLAGLAHHRRTLAGINDEIADIQTRAELAALKARDREVVREAASLTTGTITGTRCTTLAEVIRVGRRAQNCLARDQGYWTRFLGGQIDIWSLNDNAGRLVAVLQVDCATRRVVEGNGPRNRDVALKDLHPLVVWCAENGLTVGPDCDGLHPGFALPPLIAPRIVPVGDRIAHYAEWATVVRIDLRGATGRPSRLGAQSLMVAFDPGAPCGGAAFGDDDPRARIARFGKKVLRRIVGAVGLGQVAPTLVQHRLLVLAA